MWVDWMIVTNNQIIPQTFILINFVGAVDVKKKKKKSCFNNGQCLESGQILLERPPQMKKKI